MIQQTHYHGSPTMALSLHHLFSLFLNKLVVSEQWEKKKTFFDQKKKKKEDICTW